MDVIVYYAISVVNSTLRMREKVAYDTPMWFYTYTQPVLITIFYIQTRKTLKIELAVTAQILAYKKWLSDVM